MHDAGIVGSGQGLGDLPTDAQDLFHRGAPPRDPVGEGIAGEVFHDDADSRLGIDDLEDLAYERMLEACRGTRFPPQAVLRLAVAEMVRSNDLDGDSALEPRVAGEVDGTHPSLTEQLEDLVVADRLPDHGGVLTMSMSPASERAIDRLFWERDHAI